MLDKQCSATWPNRIIRISDRQMSCSYKKCFAKWPKDNIFPDNQISNVWQTMFVRRPDPEETVYDDINYLPEKAGIPFTNELTIPILWPLILIIEIWPFERQTRADSGSSGCQSNSLRSKSKSKDQSNK